MQQQQADQFVRMRKYLSLQGEWQGVMLAEIRPTVFTFYSRDFTVGIDPDNSIPHTRVPFQDIAWFEIGFADQEPRAHVAKMTGASWVLVGSVDEPDFEGRYKPP